MGPLNRDRLLVGVSMAQLSIGAVSTAVAVSRRRAYDLPMLHGRPENVRRDAVFLGTALSAPVTMLAAQAVTTVQFDKLGGARERTAIGALGAVMVAGYLGERLVRERLHRPGFDPVETPLALTGLLLAAGMAALGLTRAPVSE
jgi:hypothetical protein